LTQEPEPKKLTQEQRIALADLLRWVFVALRAPGYGYFWKSKEDWNDIEKLQQAVERSVAFGEAFHNLPMFLFQDGFSFDMLERDINGFLPARDKERFLAQLQDIRELGADCPH
jgi:hypothetical protein